MEPVRVCCFFLKTCLNLSPYRLVSLLFALSPFLLEFRNLSIIVNKRTYLEPAWFSMRYQVAEKFSLVKSPLIPGNICSMSFCGILPLETKQVNKDEHRKNARQWKLCSVLQESQKWKNNKDQNMVKLKREINALYVNYKVNKSE